MISQMILTFWYNNILGAPARKFCPGVLKSLWFAVVYIICYKLKCFIYFSIFLCKFCVSPQSNHIERYPALLGSLVRRSFKWRGGIYDAFPSPQTVNNRNTPWHQTLLSFCDHPHQKLLCIYAYHRVLVLQIRASSNIRNILYVRKRQPGATPRYSLAPRNLPQPYFVFLGLRLAPIITNHLCGINRNTIPYRLHYAVAY